MCWFMNVCESASTSQLATQFTQLLTQLIQLLNKRKWKIFDWLTDYVAWYNLRYNTNCWTKQDRWMTWHRRQFHNLVFFILFCGCQLNFLKYVAYCVLNVLVVLCQQTSNKLHAMDHTSLSSSRSRIFQTDYFSPCLPKTSLNQWSPFPGFVVLLITGRSSQWPASAQNSWIVKLSDPQPSTVWIKS